MSDVPAAPDDVPAAPLARQSLADVLDRIAQRTPAPGGGSSAAIACAVAASLVEMAARFGGAGGDGGPGGEARAGELRAAALALADADLTAYAPVLQALRRPAGDPGREAALHRAPAGAAAVPLAIAGASAEVAALAARTVTPGQLAGDAAVGAILAESACAAAALLVEIDLERSGEPEVEEARRLAGEAAAARQHALGKAHGR